MNTRISNIFDGFLVVPDMIRLVAPIFCLADQQDLGGGYQVIVGDFRVGDGDSDDGALRALDNRFVQLDVDAATSRVVAIAGIRMQGSRVPKA